MSVSEPKLLDHNAVDREDNGQSEGSGATDEEEDEISDFNSMLVSVSVFVTSARC